MSELIPQEVRELAAGIADDIERWGHYQDNNSAVEYWLPEFDEDEREDIACCIVQSPSWYAADRSDGLKLVQLLTRLDNPQLPDDVTFWNDETPTTEVLATLRKIAAGERP